MCVRTTHEGRLVVIIAVQNLVGIGEIVLIICMFFDFAPQKSHSANANRGRGFQICISQDTARNALHAQSEFECVRRGCETATLAVDRQLRHSFKTNGLAAVSTDSVGLAPATNTLEFTYGIQCIRRLVLTYTYLKSPTPICLFTMRLLWRYDDV